MYSRHFVFAALSLLCLVAGGCADLGGLQPVHSKPGVVLVSDFAFAPEIVSIDRGYTARLERKIGAHPAHQRGQRTSERVNDEIVATIVVRLREAGLEARPGGEDTLTLDQTALILTGTLRAAEPVTDKNKNSFGFGAGRGRVIAAMNAALFSPAGRREMQPFNIGPIPARRDPPVPPKVAAARNAAIATVVAAAGGPKERLSPEVEGSARRLGSAIAERVVAFGKEQGWLGAPAGAPATAAPAASQPAPAPAVEPEPPQAGENEKPGT
jgi:hypothetical protein